MTEVAVDSLVGILSSSSSMISNKSCMEVADRTRTDGARSRFRTEFAAHEELGFGLLLEEPRAVLPVRRRIAGFSSQSGEKRATRIPSWRNG